MQGGNEGSRGLRLATETKRVLLELFCDVSLLPQSTAEAMTTKKAALAELIALSEELAFYVREFRSGLEGKLRILERDVGSRRAGSVTP